MSLMRVFSFNNVYIAYLHFVSLKNKKQIMAKVIFTASEKNNVVLLNLFNVIEHFFLLGRQYMNLILGQWEFKHRYF